MVRPKTRSGCSEIMYKLETMDISHLKHDILKSKMKIMAWMNEITIYGETYSEIVGQQFNLYSASSCAL